MQQCYFVIHQVTEELGQATQVRSSVPIFNETSLDLPLLLMARWNRSKD